MPDLTLKQRFGESVVLNETSKVLSINLDDLSSIIINNVDYGLDSSGITATNKDSYASRILWTLLLKSQSVQPEINNDETLRVHIANQGKRLALCNNVSQVGFTLVATAYKNDTEGINLDPDQLA